MLARRSSLVASATALLLLAGCSSGKHDSASATSAASAAGGGAPTSDTLAFRDVFYTYASAAGLSQDDVSKLIYLAPQSMPDSADTSYTEGVDKAFTSVKPSDLYNLGAATPMNAVAGLDDALEASPVTIVVLPGIFGEFIANAPFQEVLDGTNSSFAQSFRTALQAAAAGDAAASAADTVYQLNNLQNANVNLSDVVSVGSIDAADGNPLVRVVYMKPQAGSLESMGTLDADTAIYLRRLTKLFNVIGQPNRFYLLGYSRGAATALDVAAASGSAAWGSSLAGVITLGGVNYGTGIADATQDESQPMGLIFDELATIQSSLSDCDPTASTLYNSPTIASNVALWAVHGATIAADLLKLPTHPELSLENIPTSAPDTARLWDQMWNLLTQDTIRLDQPIGDYCNNVARFKVFAQALRDGVGTLTTGSRETWWRSHTLPANLRVLAVTGTMGDASEGSVWSLVGNSTAYDPDSIDYYGLRSSYYDLLGVSGIQLNDSQVPMSRAWFWPALNSTLNPAAPAVDAHVVAVLGEHHWGYAFPTAFPMPNGEVNPFPRSVLMHALGGYIAELDGAGGGAATSGGDDAGTAAPPVTTDDAGNEDGGGGGGDWSEDAGSNGTEDGGDDSGAPSGDAHRPIRARAQAQKTVTR